MVGAVIPGWQATLQAMPAGTHWEVWIPAALAYGNAPRQSQTPQSRTQGGEQLRLIKRK